MIARLSVFDMQYKERAHFSMYRVLNNFRPVWPYKGLCTANRGEMVSVPHERLFNSVSRLCGKTAP